MPPAVMGAVVAIIGLELAPVAAQQSGLAGGSTPVGQVVQPFVMNSDVVMVSMFTLAVGIFGSVLFRGFLQIIPILVAVIAGYIFAMAKGMVNTEVIAAAPHQGSRLLNRLICHFYLGPVSRYRALFPY